MDLDPKDGSSEHHPKVVHHFGGWVLANYKSARIDKQLLMSYFVSQALLTWKGFGQSYSTQTTLQTMTWVCFKIEKHAITVSFPGLPVNSKPAKGNCVHNETPICNQKVTREDSHLCFNKHQTFRMVPRVVEVNEPQHITNRGCVALELGHS